MKPRKIKNRLIIYHWELEFNCSPLKLIPVSGQNEAPEMNERTVDLDYFWRSLFFQQCLSTPSIYCKMWCELGTDVIYGLKSLLNFNGIVSFVFLMWSSSWSVRGKPIFLVVLEETRKWWWWVWEKAKADLKWSGMQKKQYKISVFELLQSYFSTIYKCASIFPCYFSISDKDKAFPVCPFPPCHHHHLL